MPFCSPTASLIECRSEYTLTKSISIAEPRTPRGLLAKASSFSAGLRGYAARRRVILQQAEKSRTTDEDKWMQEQGITKVKAVSH